MRIQNGNFPVIAKCLFGVLLVSALSACGGDDDPDGSGVNPEPNPQPAPSPEPTPNPLVRDTAQGPVEGVDAGSMLTFKGIPYAAPPVDQLRFAPPAAPLQRTNVLSAAEFGNACPQPADGAFAPAEAISEDCLFLNVYAPKAEGSYPVMVWIHGGAFVSGSGGASYDPSRLVAEDVVVVTLNYRLGALGFLPHAALTAESGGEGSGNYGLLDQQAALRWVRENIASFGGNPDNITIFGESAGGHSVMSHLVSDPAQDEVLFHKAIAQSGAYSPAQLSLTNGEQRIGVPVVAAIGCDSAPDVAACLRGTEWEEIVASQGGYYTPVTGTGLLPQSIQTRLASGDFARVPLLAGNNIHEGRLFVALGEIPRYQAAYAEAYAAALQAGATEQEARTQGHLAGIAAGPIADQEAYYAEVEDLFAATPILDARVIADDYLALTDADPTVDASDRLSLALAAIQTDSRFACTQLGQLKEASEWTTTYGYWFMDPAAPPLFPQSIISFPMGAAHAFEIQYVLASEATLRERGGNDPQVALSETMIDYWTSFAKNGDPNPSLGVSPMWQTFVTGSGERLMTLGQPMAEEVQATNFDAEHNCGYWAMPPIVRVVN